MGFYWLANILFVFYFFVFTKSISIVIMRAIMVNTFIQIIPHLIHHSVPWNILFPYNFQKNIIVVKIFIIRSSLTCTLHITHTVTNKYITIHPLCSFYISSCSRPPCHPWTVSIYELALKIPEVHSINFTTRTTTFCFAYLSFILSHNWLF